MSDVVPGTLCFFFQQTGEIHRVVTAAVDLMILLKCDSSRPNLIDGLRRRIVPGMYQMFNIFARLSSEEITGIAHFHTFLIPIFAHLCYHKQLAFETS